MNKKTVNKVVLVAGVILLIVACNFFDLGRYLTLSYIKNSQERFQMIYI